MDHGPARDAVLTAYAQSLIKYKARRLSRKPGFNRSDEDDIAQELTVALLAKAHLFDSARGAASTFTDRVIRTAIAMLLRDRRRLKRAAGFATQSLDLTNEAAWLPKTSASDAQIELETVDQSDLVAAVAKAIQSLPPDLQDFSRRLRVDAVVVIARDLGISRRQVRNTIELIRQHFENHGLEDF